MSKKWKFILTCILIFLSLSLVFNVFSSISYFDNTDKINELKNELKVSDDEKIEIEEDRNKYREDAIKYEKERNQFREDSIKYEKENIELKNRLKEQLENVNKLDLKQLDLNLTYKLKEYKIEVKIDSKLDLMKINFLNRKNLFKYFLASENDGKRLFNVEKSLEKKKKEVESLENENINLKKSLKKGDNLIKKYKEDAVTWKNLENEYERRIKGLLLKKWLWPVGGVITVILTHLGIKYIKKLVK